jgi:uncharacterized protein
MTVTGLYHYPIKSCKGQPLQQAELGERGIVHDRAFMLATPEGRFLTQREYPRLAIVEPIVNNTTIAITAPGCSSISAEIRDTATSDEHRLQATIWGDECKTVVQKAALNEWFSDFLGTSVVLVSMEQGFRRIVDQTYAPRPDDNTGFADGFHILLLSEASLESLNARLVESGSEPVPMNRFRPNIVVSGCEAFEEDTWKQIRIGTNGESLAMDVVKPCARCIITTIDQTSGVKTGAEPIATLKKFRRNADGTKVLFGQNVVNTDCGSISIGDTLEIVA